MRVAALRSKKVCQAELRPLEAAMLFLYLAASDSPTRAREVARPGLAGADAG